MFGTSNEEMLEHLEKGDVAETVRIFFEDSEKLKPAKKSTLTLYDVDKYLDDLKDLTTEETQSNILQKIAKR